MERALLYFCGQAVQSAVVSPSTDPKSLSRVTSAAPRADAVAAIQKSFRERVRVEKEDHRPVSRTCDVEQPLGARGQLAGLDHALQFIDIARFQIR